EAPEFADEIRERADLEHHRRRPDHLSAFRLFRHEQNLVLAVDHAREAIQVVELRAGIVGAVGGLEDLADGGHVACPRLTDFDHQGSPVCRGAAGSPSLANSCSSGAASSRATRAVRSGSVATITCSWVACAPSPTAPRPSSVAVY